MEPFAILNSTKRKAVISVTFLIRLDSQKTPYFHSTPIEPWRIEFLYYFSYLHTMNVLKMYIELERISEYLQELSWEIKSNLLWCWSCGIGAAVLGVHMVVRYICKNTRAGAVTIRQSVMVLN